MTKFIRIRLAYVAHEICFQILKTEMIMDLVVDTQLELYKLVIEFRSFHFIYLVQATQVSLHMYRWQSGSREDSWVELKGNVEGIMVRKIK